MPGLRYQGRCGGPVAILVMGVKWLGDESSPVEEQRSAVAAALGVEEERITALEVVKRSLDARQRAKRWVANYKVELSGDEAALLARGVKGARAWTLRDEERYGDFDRATIPRKAWPPDVRPIVVGAGPAGLFAALRLAEAGAKVLLIERGEPVEQRVPTVNMTWRNKRPLDPESNVVFGEGGAGTFSDGKIYTRRRDGDLGYVFQRLVSFGADPEIQTSAYAHLGTDRVRAILPVFRERLRELGAEIHFNTSVQRFLSEGGRCVGVALSTGEVIRRAPVIVAAGHSARDTYRALYEAGAQCEARPIAIGARIEHPQAVIDQARYRGPRGDLPPASYRLTHTPNKGRAAHTFCMCPGGVVVPATAQEGRVVVNGMSFAARRAFWANSAIIVQVQAAEYPKVSKNPLGGLDYQDRIEQRAFELAGGDYKAPAQRVEDLLAGRVSAELPRSSYPQGLSAVDLREVLPSGLISGLKKAIRSFDKKIPGFAGPEALLIAPETRTTSPVRFLRDRELHAEGLRDLLPVGEGAGYAGGIVSAALDGVRAAESLVERYAPRETVGISRG